MFEWVVDDSDLVITPARLQSDVLEPAKDLAASEQAVASENEKSVPSAKAENNKVAEKEVKPPVTKKEAKLKMPLFVLAQIKLMI